MQNEVGKELLAKYLANECSISEKALVENWLTADPLNRDEFNYIKSIWNASGNKSINWDVEKAWDKFAIKSGIKKKSSITVVNTKSSTNIVTLKKLVPAFSIILILSASVIYFNMLTTQPIPVKIVSTANAFHKINTEKSQRVNFKLSDGSEVFLNSSSSIKFPINFSYGKREIFLDGEAYFKVVHKENEPFVVNIHNGIVEDIGTEFNIKAWKSDKNSQVAVSSGEVEVKSNIIDKSVRLKEGQLTMISGDGLVLSPTDAKIDHLTGWLKGKLYFDNSTLSDVFKNLDRSYNLYCTISDSLLLSLHLSAVFGEEKPEEIIHIISLALDLDHIKLDDIIHFYPGKHFNKKNKYSRF